MYNDFAHIKERNIGLDFLKAWMAFEVVLCHYGAGSQQLVFMCFFNLFTRLAVPVFMIVSFYLSGKFVFSNDSNPVNLLRRIKRLFVPLILWAVIYWFVYNTLALFCNIDSIRLSFKSLLLQILTGHSYNTAMWFNIVLILLTLLFFSVCKVLKKYATILIFVLSLLAVFCIYSGNNNFFMNLPIEYAFPLGRICEMIPFAGFGLLMYRYKSYNKFHLIILFVFSVIFIKIITEILYPVNIISYHYSGIKLFIASVFLVIIMVYLPMLKLPLMVKSVISFFSKYSMGVYCMHILVGTMLSFLNLNITPFYNSILIFISSIMISFLVDKIPVNFCQAIVK